MGMMTSHFRRIRRILWIVALLSAARMPLHAALTASEAAVSFAHSSTTGLGNSGFTVGWTFTLAEERTVTHLGLYGAINSTFPNAREIGLWDVVGTLVSQVSIPVGGAGLELDPDSVNSNFGFFYQELGSPIVLNAGTEYTIAIPYLGGSDPGTYYNAIITPMDGLTYGTSVFRSGASTLTKPTTVDTSYPNGWFGGNLRFATVPEPGSLALLALGAGVCCFSRKRERHPLR